MGETLIFLTKITLQEIFGILGIFFVLGFFLSGVQKATHRVYLRTIGWKGILLTAWIGTPIHELGHALLAKIFRHHVTEVSLFSPNEATGGLGHVEHSYKRRSIYQNIGNFFIGAAPLLGGAAVMIALLHFLVPNGKEIFALFNGSYTLESDFFVIIKNIFFTFFSSENIHRTSFWIFLFVSFCIASHLAPSKQDRKIMWRGLVFIVIILFLWNAFTFWRSGESNFSSVIIFFPLLTGVFLYALFLSIVHFLLVFLILRVPFFLFGRRR